MRTYSGEFLAKLMSYQQKTGTESSVADVLTGTVTVMLNSRTGEWFYLDTRRIPDLGPDWMCIQHVLPYRQDLTLQEPNLPERNVLVNNRLVFEYLFFPQGKQLTLARLVQRIEQFTVGILDESKDTPTYHELDTLRLISRVAYSTLVCEFREEGIGISRTELESYRGKIGCPSSDISQVYRRICARRGRPNTPQTIGMWNRLRKEMGMATCA